MRTQPALGGGACAGPVHACAAHHGVAVRHHRRIDLSPRDALVGLLEKQLTRLVLAYLSPQLVPPVSPGKR